MKKHDPKNRQKLPKGTTNRSTKEQEPSPQSLQADNNPKTAPAIAVPADSINYVSPTMIQGKLSDMRNTSQAVPQDPQMRMRMLDILSAGRLQPPEQTAQKSDGNSETPPSTLPLLQSQNQEGHNNNNPLVVPDSPVQSSAVTAPHPRTSEQETASIHAQSLLVPGNEILPKTGDGQNALHPVSRGAKAPMETTTLVLQPGGEPSQSPGKNQAQSPGQSSAGDKSSAAPEKHIEWLLNEMGNLQIKNFSTTDFQAKTSALDSVQASKGPVPRKTSTNFTLDSAGTVRQKQRAVNLQNTGKAKGAANAPNTSHDTGSNPPPIAMAAASSDATKDGESSKDSPAGHSSGSQVSGSRNSSAPGNSSSAAASSPMATANPLVPAPSQSTTSRSEPARADSLPQSAAPHGPTGDRIAATVEDSLNPAGGAVNSASMLQTPGKSEMRVALQTDHLGPVELHAVLEAGHVGASIAVVNHEAHTILTNNLPALQQALTDQNVRLDHISVLNTPVSSGTNTGSGGSFHSGGQAQPRPHTQEWDISRPIQVVPGSNESSVAEAPRGRISVRA